MPSPTPQAIAKLSLGLVQLATGVQVLVLSKPSSEVNNLMYAVTGDSNDPTIWLGYDWKAGPAYLHFQAENGLAITALGFLRLETNTPPWPNPEKHTRQGDCGGGGSFQLTADIPQEGTDFVEVKNLGEAAKFGYSLRIWTKTAGEPNKPFDPRVYNHGVIGHENNEPWWRRLLQRLRR